MFKNFLTTTIRNLKRNKANTFINVLGLTISIACCIAIYVFIKHEHTFDHFHQNGDRIYRIVSQYRGADGVSYEGYVTFPLAKALRNDFPELEVVSQVYNRNEAIIRIPDESGQSKRFKEDEMAYADEYFLQTFDYKLLAGQPGQLLTNPDEVVLTQKLADKFFGESYRGRYEELINKRITVNNQEFYISGILQDIPRNTNVAFRMLLPFKAFERNYPGWVTDWKSTNNNSFVFITLPHRYPPNQLEERLVDFTNKYFDQEMAERRTYLLQALSNIHTDETYGGTQYATPAVLTTAFIIMGIVVLLTACINFINLATAQSIKRAKEVGIRKTLGSLRWQLIVQFMSETLLLVLVASGIALLLAQIFIDTLNQYLLFVVDLDLHLDYTVFVYLIGLILLFTVLAGYYPAQVLAKYNPVQALKQTITSPNAGFAGTFSLRKGLIVVQFMISQLLVIGTIVVAMQMDYFYNRDLGYTKEGILTVAIPENDRQKMELFRNKLLTQTSISAVSFNSGPPTSSRQLNGDFSHPFAGKGEKYSIEKKCIDPEYLPTYNIPLLAGRNLREDDRIMLRSDTTNYYNGLLNMRAIRTLGYQRPEEVIGQQIIVDENRVTVVGVVDNFFNVSMKQEIRPCILFYGSNWVWTASIKMNMQQSAATFGLIKGHWEELYPEHFYESYDLDEYFKYGAFYVIEDLMYQTFKIFSVLSILIGCLGLYGLVSFLALQRQKEIGIRKILGASVSQILYLFSREFALLVLLAFMVAAPVGYMAMKAWLNTFAYRIDMQIGYFVITLAISIFIAGITIGYQAIKAAMANPVKSLRNE